MKKTRACKECGEPTTNKVYCSRKCQATGVGKDKTVPRVETSCTFCGKKYKAKQWELDNGKKKYCSRKCKDTHQKELYSNDGNPAYGTQKTQEWKDWNSKRMKSLWKENSHRELVSLGQERYVRENGYWPGTDENANKKRRKTCLNKYGVPHNWMCPEIRAKCDETTLKRHGLTSVEIMLSAQCATNITNIETILSGALHTMGMEFKHSHYLYYNDNKNYRIYDFYIPGFNLLIEADGDYWHGNPMYFSSYTETQQINMANDEFKNQLAAEQGYNLLRFWETDIKADDFSNKLLHELKSYGKEG